MSKRRLRRYTIHQKNIVRFRILFRNINESENFIKLLGDDSTNKTADIHFGLVQKPHGFEPHIAYEPRRGLKKSHRYLTPLSKEEAVNLLLQIFSMPDDAPPRISSVCNAIEMQVAQNWLSSARARAIRLPSHQRVKVFKEGPVKELVDKLLNADYPGDASVDVEELGQLSDEQLNDDDAFEWKYEDEIHARSLEIGFIEGPDHVLFFTPEGQVVELDIDAVMAFVNSLDKLPGIDEYFEELRARGIIS